MIRTRVRAGAETGHGDERDRLVKALRAKAGTAAFFGGAGGRDGGG
ncbi:hypothetical protein HTV45_14075 [Streptomyces sp. CHD11]|nr:hypothetical protein [Streptomyces sp. CHD11]MBT3151993.1 hypothetical protein [Streptomyces sp. CHD11]